MSADAVIRIGGNTIKVNARGAQGPRGFNGPDLAELAASGGAALVGHLGRTVADKLGETASVEDYRYDGITVRTDTQAIQAAVNAARRVHFPAGEYSISSVITLPDEDGIELYGDGWATKVTSSSANGCVDIGSSVGVVIRDMWLHAESGDTSHGCVTTFHTELENVVLERLKMTTGAVSTNGVKLVTDNATNGINGFVIRNCLIDTPGRMGVEVQNHNADSAIRYRKVSVENCKIIATGTVSGSGSGMGVSFSGEGEDCAILDNTFDACIGPAIELIGPSRTHVQRNTIKNQVGSRPIQCANSILMTGNIITHNIVTGGTPTSVYFGSLAKSLVAHNEFDLSGGTGGMLTIAGTATGAGNNRIVGNRVITGHTTALIADNIGYLTIIDNDLDNSASGANVSALRLYNTSTQYCYVARNRIAKGTGGQFWDENTGAANNVFDGNIEGGTGLVRVKLRAGELRGSATYDPSSIAAGGTATTTVTVTGAALGDYAIAAFSLNLQGIVMTAYVSATNTVTVVLYNPTAGAIDLGSGALRVRTSSYSA